MNSRRRRHTERRIKTMNAVNSVQLFILVWTAVCQADDDVCRVSCDDVTGTVGKEVTLICSISQKCSECCITLCKFPEVHNDLRNCRQKFPQDSCEQRNSFTCRYTPTTAMMGKFTFHLQTQCARKNTEFTVNITEPSNPEIDSEAPEPIKSQINPEDPDKKEEPLWDKSKASKPERAEGRGFEVAVIAAVVNCFIIAS